MLELVGRVVVYSVAGCPHCLAAKKTLRDHGIPVIDVPVDRFPAVRTWLHEKTGKTSVPQIFFNEEYVGGNDSLQRAVKDEETWGRLLTEVQQNPAKEDALIIPHPSEATDAQSNETVFTCEIDPISEVVEEIRASGLLQSHRTSLFSSPKMAFSGYDFVQWMVEAKKMNESEAVKVGSELLQKKYILPVKDNIENFFSKSDVFYSLNEGNESCALNSGAIDSCVIEDAGQLAEALRKLVLRLYSDHISTDGRKVDYVSIKASEEFQHYQSLARQLQRAPVEKLDQDGLKAFFINVYNALVIHATVQNGPATNWLTRLKFFDRMCYIIGGRNYSLTDIENGVLRANRRGVVQLFPPFGKSDPRRKMSLIQVDPRIHFALNCGARSCPPVKTFSAENINEELQLATNSYLEGDDALKVESDGDRSHIHLSSLLRWYRHDFGDNQEEVLRWTARNAGRGEKAKALQEALETGKWKDETKLYYMVLRR
ncbi:hypothetical protein Pcinc_018647 [Petrolisthes cinctipes]|uniref:DEP domain-containing protein n=1 Tax=Petrolisthes cinctipes TaxID=88211 RepID=A0AAE1FM48_PETCI|nr:hypothetical protein Pcinc_018647 [Petrolisthes cinctipes]